jgi:hypothetical protein
MMKIAFQPEVDKFLRDNGNTHRVNWREAMAARSTASRTRWRRVRDNITDIGYVGTLWEGSTMPLQNVTYFTPFAIRRPRLIANAFDKMNEGAAGDPAELVLAEHGAAEQLHHRHLPHLVELPVRTLDDLRNRKISAPAPAPAGSRAPGATPVDGALTTYYTDIQTGVSEGALSFFVASCRPRPRGGALHHQVRRGRDVCGRHRRQPAALRALAGAGAPRHGPGRPRATQAHIRDVASSHGLGEAEMVRQGAVITTLPNAERERWIRGLPNLARTWADSSGAASRDVLNAYFAAIREAGQAPGRNWDRELTS